MNALIVDAFAGGGGASDGIRRALGRSPDIAINHDPEAIALHTANHPETQHFTESVWKVDPVEVCAGSDVELLWLSPDCTHFSKARGGKPKKKGIRSLAWLAVRWAAAVRPSVIVLENVEEFQTWGPLLPNGIACPERKGQTFRSFVRKLERLGYVVEWRELRACDYGSPTIRKRLFLIARCDGNPIEWPRPTHGRAPGLRAWRTAAECIDWSLPCPSIFLTPAEAKALGVRRPLADATLRRIARGIKRFVLDNPQPFIVQYHSAKCQGDDRVASLHEPLLTQSTENRFGLVSPIIVGVGGRAGQSEPRPVDRPYHTTTGKADTALVTAFLAKHFGGNYNGAGAPVDGPMHTITGVDHQAVVASHLIKLSQNSTGQDPREPLDTVMAGAVRFGEVRAFLCAYYGSEKDGASLSDPCRTVTSKERFGLVTVHGQQYAIGDIGMRMLSPRELYRAQGFTDEYLIDIAYNGKPLTKRAQVRMVGNSVCPDAAAAIVRSNVSPVPMEAVA